MVATMHANTAVIAVGFPEQPFRPKKAGGETAVTVRDMPVSTPGARILLLYRTCVNIWDIHVAR